MSGGGPGEADWLRAMLTFHAGPPPASDPVEMGAVDELAAALRLGLALRGRTAPAALLPANLDLGLRRAVLEAVLPDADVAPAQAGWLLRDGPRRAVLAELGPDQVRALAANLAPQDEISQALLLLQDEPPALDTLSTEAIGAAVRTLDTVGPGLSAWTAQQAQCAAQALRRRNRREDYGQLADGFVGRRWDLRLLHGFLTQPLASQAEWAQPAVAALVVGGPGGTGKSALLARVLGELLDADSGLPLVHLDFDRPALDPLIPGSLDSELLRQLCLLGGEVEAFLTPLAAFIRGGSGSGSSHAGPSQEAADSRAAASMEDSLGWLRRAGRPLLLVLDTTEQVQAGGASRVEALLQWIGRLGAGSGAPEVRVVLAGRGDPEAWSMQGSAGRTVLAGGGGAGPRDRARLRQIPDLGPSEAARLLESRGVTATQAPALARRFGGNPLVLRLVADLVRDGDALDIADGALPQGLVQGYLYDRILKHLDEPARSFAHPGVVLPELTLPMIGGILAPAKQRTLAPGEDVTVFEGLARPAWLMRREGGTLRLRPDLRRLTRQLIASDPAHAAETREVHVLASEWHAAQDGPEHAAMALYHRLMLGEMTLPATLPPAAGPVLVSLLDDLMEPMRTAVQARMGQTVGAEAALEALSDKDWSAYLDDEGGAGDKLSNARASDALAIWRSRPTGKPGEPPTFVLQALAETGEWDSAEVDLLRVAVALTGSAASGDRAPPGERLYWAVCLNLMRPPHVLHTPLVPVLRAALAAPRQRQWRPDDLLRLAALAELLTPGLDVLPQRGRVADEPRTPRVVLALARGGDQSRTVTADAMVVMQTDWLQRLGANVPGVYWNTGSAQRAQDLIDRVDGGQLAAVPDRLRLLESVNVAIGPCGRGDDRRLAPWLRDATPELHRPARDALWAALPTEQADPVLAQWRRRLTVVPAELSAPALLSRLARDPAGYWLQVVRFADSARTLGVLLAAARRAAPNAARLANVAETFDAWDVALGLGWRSEWTAYGEPYGRNEDSEP